jgi:hypothetical protein
MAQTLGLSTFRASEHWIKQFKVRHDIRVRVLQDEASSADVVNIHIAHSMIPKLLRGVSGHDSYNLDETGVYYQISDHDHWTHKLPIMIIGSAKRVGVGLKDQDVFPLAGNQEETLKFVTQATSLHGWRGMPNTCSSSTRR